MSGPRVVFDASGSVRVQFEDAEDAEDFACWLQEVEEIGGRVEQEGADLIVFGVSAPVLEKILEEGGWTEDDSGTEGKA